MVGIEKSIPKRDMKKADIEYREKIARDGAFIQKVRDALTPLTKDVTVIENGQVKEVQVTRLGLGPIDTPFGKFYEFEFEVGDRWKEYNVLVKAGLDDKFNPQFEDGKILVRMDSACKTGQLFHDKTCDCKLQLLKAMHEIEKNGSGMIVHMPKQDGRGMGLSFKLGTLMLQDELGYNTVEAAAALKSMEFIEPEALDPRTYGGVIAILRFFGIDSGFDINVATNNPKKIQAFQENGYDVGRTPVIIPPNEYTKRHLDAKEETFHHDLRRDND
ncbi:MAG: GTP cyclohydrolase II [Candidatus Micrarchaeales archaeon]|jgi:GTP cyclohydrolase II|nr:MAG: GTP cyclohydrolase II [Candidatus Micrarchaeum acidiphilum ARMAN-2]MCW6160785.1 GTP cyclohydrolase II [Candidatus Micrarchaeales archaeon]